MHKSVPKRLILDLILQDNEFPAQEDPTLQNDAVCGSISLTVQSLSLLTHPFHAEIEKD
jgi:hypothetical protein